MEKPYIAITLGDPAGIGPEIVLKTLADKDTLSIANCVVVGEKSVLRKAMQYADMPTLTINTIDDPAQGDYREGILNLIDLKNIDIAKLKIGAVSALCARAAFEYITRAIDLALSKKVSAVVTSPVNKESFKEGRIPYIGHTEIFSDLTKTPDPLTLFEVRGLRIFFLTRHLALRVACDRVTKSRIKDYVYRCTEALKKLGITEGTMAVAGLNPHSGEHGLFGDEEVVHIIPAVTELTSEGYKVEGPIGADSVFHQALMGKYNSVLSLYHDQGHIAAKTLDFERTISITAGMPILRTSVDHGTAFDIAGTGRASAVSLIEAVRIAVKYFPNFK